MQILVFGAGGHGKVVADLARAVGYEILGFVDRDEAKLGQRVHSGGGSVLYTEDSLPASLKAEGTIDGKRVAIALGIGDNEARLRYADMLGACDLPALIHPSAAFSTESTARNGAVVFANAVVNAGATLGRVAIVNSSAVVEHDCVLGDGSHLSPGAVMSGASRIGKLSWIGAQAVILPGVSVGDRAIAGAGAVVLHDVPADVTVIGNPARPKQS